MHEIVLIAWTSAVSMETVLSLVSISMTGYFWLVKVRRERPSLTFYQLYDFRATLRTAPGNPGKRLCLSQMDTGGFLVANHSSRQNAIVRFECELLGGRQPVKGSWGYTGDGKPPWNLPPESSVALSPACFFDVPADFQIPNDLRFRMEFITVSGTHFSQECGLRAPRY